MSWKIALARCVGKVHIREGKGCEDAVYSLDTAKTAVIALADGAGSKRYGGEGAAIVVRAICEYVAAHFGELLADPAGRGKKLCSVVEENLRKSEFPFEELGSTLLFAAVCERDCIFGHLGDGVMLYREDGGAQILSLPENGDHINETFLTTDPDLMTHLRIHDGVLHAPCDLMLMSDGCSGILVDVLSGKVAENCNVILDWNGTHERACVERDMEEVMKETFSQMTQDDMSIAVLRVE